MNSPPSPARLPHSAFRILHSALLLALLAGCAVGPDFSRPETNLPASYLAGGASGATNAPSWFDGFHDAVLSELLVSARTNNLGVLQAVQRVRASRAALSGAKAEHGPRAGFSASASKAKTFDPDATTERAGVGFDASWEPDLFGKVRRGVEAARAELAATELSLTDALVSLDAEIAAEYVNLRLLQTQLGVAVTNLSLQRTTFSIAKAKYDAGLSSELASLSSEAQLRATEAALPAARSAIAACIRRIEILCAQNPGALDALLSAPAPIPDAPAVALSIPSDLLRRRPDVRRAEQTYAAALARVGVARASYYPSVSIGAGASLSSASFSDWGDAVKTLSFGPSAQWDVLTFGRTAARVEQARAAAEEAALSYRETVLRAVHEVETQAVALRETIARAEPLRAAADAQARALALSQALYERDLGEYLDVVAAQQGRVSADRTLAEALADIALGRIALYKALGGGAD